jgi:hypothetical protein
LTVTKICKRQKQWYIEGKTQPCENSNEVRAWQEKRWNAFIAESALVIYPSKHTASIVRGNAEAEQRTTEAARTL